MPIWHEGENGTAAEDIAESFLNHLEATTGDRDPRGNKGVRGALTSFYETTAWKGA